MAEDVNRIISTEVEAVTCNASSHTAQNTYQSERAARNFRHESSTSALCGVSIDERHASRHFPHDKSEENKP